MVDFGIIYCARNSINGKVYVGQTTESLDKRRLDHERCRSTSSRRLAFASAILKYGKENFVWSTLQVCQSLEELDAAEIFWIKKLHSFWKDPLCNGYNLTIGGRNGVGVGEDHPCYGIKRTHSKDTRRKMSESHKGKKLSSEHIQHLKIAHRGHVVSDETRMRLQVSSSKQIHSVLSRENQASKMRGRTLSEEHRQKIRNSAPRGGQNNKSKRVVCLNYSTEYSTIKEASKALGLDVDAISRLCKTRKESYFRDKNGFRLRFSFVEEACCE